MGEKSNPKKNFQIPYKTYDTLSLQEVVCNICTSLAYPPVILPCDHLLCYECYERIKLEGRLTCPMCRKRFGTFDRRMKSEVVNVNLQEAILRFFPERVELRISGQDNGIDKEFQEKELTESRHISKQGEVNREYLLALEEDNRKRQQEQIASERQAEEIQREEEERANELIKREEEDAEVAQRLFQQEQAEYHQLKQEKERLEQLDKELALNVLKEQGEARVPPPRITQKSLDSYLGTETNVASHTVASSGPGGEEPIVIPSTSVKTEPEEWLEETYLQAQIEMDRKLAEQIQKEVEQEIKNSEKKRVNEYKLRSSSKKKKTGMTPRSGTTRWSLLLRQSEQLDPAWYQDMCFHGGMVLGVLVGQSSSTMEIHTLRHIFKDN